MGILKGVRNYFGVKNGTDVETIDESKRRFLINSAIGVAGVAAAGIGVNELIKKNQIDKDNLSYLIEKHKNNIKNLPLGFQSILNNPKADHMLVYLYLEMISRGKSFFNVNDYIEILTRTGNWKECVLKEETPQIEPAYWFVANYFIYIWRIPLISPGNTVQLDLIKRFNISKNNPIYYFNNGIGLYLLKQRDKNDTRIKTNNQSEGILIDYFIAGDDFLEAIFIAAGRTGNEVYKYTTSINNNYHNKSDLNETWYLEYLKETDIKKKNEAFKKFIELEKIKRNQLKIVFTELKKQTDINKLIAAWSCYIYCNGRKTFNVVKHNKDYEADLIKEEILMPLSKYVPEIGIKLSEYNYNYS